MARSLTSVRDGESSLIYHLPIYAGTERNLWTRERNLWTYQYACYVWEGYITAHEAYGTHTMDARQCRPGSEHKYEYE